MKAKTSWILVADGEKARILARQGSRAALELVSGGAFSHDVERVGALGGDRPGRTQESANAARHAIEPHVDWRREGKRDFAHHLAKVLEDKAGNNAFDRLILVAAPRTLGDLREALGPRARERLAGELDKDLTEHPVGEIEQRLSQAKLI